MKTPVALGRDIRRLSVRAQTLRIDGIGHGDRCEWFSISGLHRAVSCKTIYRWIREEIKRRMVKSGSRYLDVVRHCRGSRLESNEGPNLANRTFSDVAQISEVKKFLAKSCMR